MNAMLRRSGFSLLLVAAALAAPAVTVGQDRTVEMVDNAFQPPTVEIVVGDAVTWVNAGNAPHDATGDGWSTPLLTAGQSASVRFDSAGSYGYICSIHPDMTGTVVVQAPSGGSGGPGGSGGSGGSGGGAGPSMPGTDTVAPAPRGAEGSPTLAPAGVVLLLLAAVVYAVGRLAGRRAR